MGYPDFVDGRNRQIADGASTFGSTGFASRRVTWNSDGLTLKGEMMIDSMVLRFTARKIGYGSLLLGLLLATVIPTSSQDNGDVETLDATAMGTSTQMGRTVGIKVNIFRYSTDADRQVLVKAFLRGNNRGWSRRWKK